MAFGPRRWLPALALVLLGAAPARPSLSEVLAQMRAASGEPYNYHVVSVSSSQQDGLTVTTRTETYKQNYLTQTCEGNLCTGDYFDGVTMRAVSINDTALENSRVLSKVVRGLRAVSSGRFTDPAFVREGGVVTDLGTMARANRTLRALGVTAKDAIPLIVLVDPKTWLVDSVRDWKSDYSYVDTDYRRVGPLTLPFEIDEVGSVPQRFTQRSISPQPFAAPAGIATQTLGPAALPMTGSTPVIPCTLGGLQRRCMIDTGNSGLAISRELAEALDLSPVGAFEVQGLGRYATEVVKAGPLIVGNKTFAPAKFVVLHDIHQYGYDVVLGADFLANTVVRIDYGKREVVLDAPDERSAQSLPIGFINSVPVLPVALGSTIALLAVDTGDESTINLSYAYYKAHPGLFAATDSRSVSGVGGASEELLGRIDRVQVGTFRVEAQTIGATRLLQATGEGHLGAGFLSHFRVVLDYAGGRLGLTPREGDAAVK